MKALYNFIEDGTGFDIGDLNGLELSVCPRAGEMVAFAADGQGDEVRYTVEHVKHIIHRNLDGEIAQIVDVSVRPVVAAN